MSATIATTEPAVADPTQRVHHHAYVHDRARRLAGEPVTSICGITRRDNPRARDLPCCPMCASMLAASGQTCGGER